ncbi:O-antigen ligase family protein [Clostridium perfringens]
MKVRTKIVYGGVDIGKFIFSNEFIIAILFFPFFKSSGFEGIPYLSLICNIMIVIECVLFFIMFFLMKERSNFFKLLVLFGLWSYIIGPFIHNHIPPSFFYIAGALGIVTLFHMGMYYNSKKTLNALSKLFTFMIIINLLTILLFKNGIVNTIDGSRVFLFGLRTGFSLYIIPGILFNLMNDSIRKRSTFSSGTLTCFIIGVISLLLEWIATGLVEIIIIIIMYVLVYIYYSKLFMNLKILFLSIMGIDFAITFLGKQNSLMTAFANYLGKDVTLSGRTYIWNCVLRKLSESPFFGFGINSTVSIYGIDKPAHNQWLHISMESGYIGAIILIIAVYFSCKYMMRYKNTNIYKIFTIWVVAILVGAITEIQTYVPFIYMIFEIPYVIKFVNVEDSTFPCLIKIKLKG